ncbi:MAG: serine/threonine-protein kinase [Planctomycetota bacterium]|nr:serine/threonine-protein kinase [Planctomycetota bacterium]
MDHDAIKSAFLAALDRGLHERPAAERARGVRELLGALASPERESEVLSLLESHLASDDFLESSALDDAGLAPGVTAAPVQPGTRLGPFVIEAALGEGGMGVVFRARQDTPARAVALKVMRTGLLARGLTRRFEREAQALARLQHPGIAQVYSAGVGHVQGQPVPFLAMELCEGPPLDKFVRASAPSIRARVELLARVAEAVAHAHQRGVVHRDLKPANILVGPGSQPKVLDFGIARLIESDRDSSTPAGTLATVRGEILGTIAYMAPEQFGNDTGAIDLRADVYALGVILYETLSGRAPIDVGTLSITAAAHAIATREPRALGALEPALRGDLEAIAAKALEKDPVRRYQSASELLEDLRRHLREEPILARRSTRLYRATKFIRRNRAVSALAALAFLTLASGLATTLWQARRAQAEVRATNQTNVFLRDILLAVAPSNAQGQVVTMRMALDDASARLTAGAITDQRVLSSLHGVLSKAYYELGVFDRAEVHMRDAIRVRRQLHGEYSKEHLDGIGDLCIILGIAGNNTEVLRLAPPALKAARATLDPDSETTLRLITAVANAADGTDPELAGKLYAESLERNRRARGPEHPLTLIALNNLASWHLGQGRFSEGEKIHRELLDIRLRTLGENHPDTIVSLRNVGSSLAVQQRTAESIEFLSRVVEIGDRVRGASHPAQLSARVELAIGHAFQNDIDRALALLRESLPRTLSASGKPTPDTFSYLESLCNILMHAQRFDAALVEANAAIKAAGEVFGADSTDARRAYTLARAAHEALGDLSAARAANAKLKGLPEYEPRWDAPPADAPAPPAGE